jgi:hypothetical protein
MQQMLREAVVEASATQVFRTQDPSGATRAVLLLCRSVADWYSPSGRQTAEEIAGDYTRFALAQVEDSESTHLLMPARRVGPIFWLASAPVRRSP